MEKEFIKIDSVRLFGRCVSFVSLVFWFCSKAILASFSFTIALSPFTISKTRGRLTKHPYPYPTHVWGVIWAGWEGINS